VAKRCTAVRHAQILVDEVWREACLDHYSAP
jgi:hypothetical protein